MASVGAMVMVDDGTVVPKSMVRYRYGICDHGGNLVFQEPWKEKKIHGSGYISHKVGGCGLYEMDQLPEITAEVEKANKRKEERQ